MFAARFGLVIFQGRAAVDEKLQLKNYAVLVRSLRFAEARRCRLGPEQVATLIPRKCLSLRLTVPMRRFLVYKIAAVLVPFALVCFDPPPPIGLSQRGLLSRTGQVLAKDYRRERPASQPQWFEFFLSVDINKQTPS